MTENKRWMALLQSCANYRGVRITLRLPPTPLRVSSTQNRLDVHKQVIHNIKYGSLYDKECISNLCRYAADVGNIRHTW
jgi:hypothetical protein